jgi:type I restriction enzyme S subunit
MAKKKIDKNDNGIITVDDLYKVPKNWKWVTLDSIGTIVTGSTPSKKREEYYGGDFPFIKPADLDQGRNVFEASEYLTDEGKEVSRILPPNSTSVCCIGSIGKTGYLGFEATTNQQINTIIPRINSLYVYYYCNTNSFINSLQSLASATTIALVNKTKMSTVPFPLAPLPEQQRIVNRIESLFEKIDKAEALINEARECFEKRKEAILAKAFRGELTEKWREEHNQVPLSEQQMDELKSKMTKKQKLLYESKDITDDVHELPKTWEWIRLGSVYNFVGGGTPSKAKEAYWNGSIPWTTVKDIKGDFLYDSQDSITQLGLDNSSANIANKGDVILITRMSPGKTIISNIDTAINQDLKIVKPIYDIPSLYTHYYFKSIIGVCENMAKGTTVKGIRLEQIKNLLFPLAPHKEMKEISSILVELLEEENKINDLSDQMEELSAIKKSILAKAFRGELGTNRKNEENVDMSLNM